MSETRPEPTVVESVPGLFDIVVRPVSVLPDVARGMLGLCLIVVPICFVAGILAPNVVALGLPLLDSTAAAFAAMTAPLWVVMLGWWHRRQRVHGRRSAERFAELWREGAAPAVAASLIGHRLHVSDLFMLSEFAASLARRGKTGITIRMCHARFHTAPVPIEMPFEPRPLIESDPTFYELEQATDPASASNERNEVDSEADQTRRSIRRGFRLLGQPGSVIVLGCLFAFNALRAYQQRAVTFELVCMIVVLLSIVLGWTGIFRRYPNPHIVPGGILMPVALHGTRKRESLRMITREHGVLILVQHARHSFLATASDGSAYGTAALTAREVAMLLRAWYSTVPPPDASDAVNMVYQKTA